MNCQAARSELTHAATERSGLLDLHANQFAIKTMRVVVTET